MTEVRRENWIPCPRSFTKKVEKACYGSKRFQVIAFNNPPPGELTEDQDVGSRPCEVIGVDYPEWIYYCSNM